MAEGIEKHRSPWEKRKDLPLLRWRPTEGPSVSTMRSAAERSPGEPTRVPLSRYQAFKARVGTSALIRSTMGWRVKATPSKPRGPPAAPHSNCEWNSYPDGGEVGTNSRILSKRRVREGGDGTPQTWPHG